MPKIIEGTWEEIQKHAAKLAGKNVRVTILAASGRAARASGKKKSKTKRGSVRSQPAWLSRPNITGSGKPVKDVDALLKKMNLGKKAVDGLWAAIAENRARRRGLLREKESE